MIFAASATLCVILVEVFAWLPVMATVKRLISVAGKARAVLLSERISDHWKERVLLKYAGRIFANTVELSGYLLLLGLLVYAAIVGVRYVGLDLYHFLTGWQGIVFCIIVAGVYAKLRIRDA